MGVLVLAYTNVCALSVSPTSPFLPQVLILTGQFEDAIDVFNGGDEHSHFILCMSSCHVASPALEACYSP